MRKLVRNRLIDAVMISWLIYWPIVLLVDPSIILELINGMVASLSIGLVVAYAPGIWTLTRRFPYHITGADMLVLGITIMQAALAALFTWAWWYRFLDDPEWMIDHPFRGWMTYLLMIGSALHLLASDVGVINNAVPERGWVHLGMAIFAGLAIGTAVITIMGRTA